MNKLTSKRGRNFEHGLQTIFSSDQLMVTAIVEPCHLEIFIEFKHSIIWKSEKMPYTETRQRGKNYWIFQNVQI